MISNQELRLNILKLVINTGVGNSRWGDTSLQKAEEFYQWVVKYDGVAITTNWPEEKYSPPEGDHTNG